MTKPQAKITLAIASAVLAVTMSAAGGAAFAATYSSAQAPRHHSKIALQCSEEANLKGLHGNARQAFRRHCIREHSASVTSSHHAASANYDHPAHKAVLKSPTPKKVDKTS